jgi:histidine triad (HIT) family protein
MASIFTKIVKGEIPAFKIAEDENYLAFLDVFPLAKGHVLVIPKQEIDSIFDLSDESYANLWLFAKNTAKALKMAMPCKRVGIAVIGLEVPHAHIHLIPLQNVEDINFSKPKMIIAEDEMALISEKIKAELQ